MLRVRVCAAHKGGFLGPKFSKQGSLFRQIFLKQGWVIQKLTKNSKNEWFSGKIHHKLKNLSLILCLKLFTLLDDFRPDCRLFQSLGPI